MRLKVKTFVVCIPACWGRALKPQSFCGGRSRKLAVFSCCLISFAFHLSGGSVPVKGLLQDTKLSGRFWQSQTSSGFSGLCTNLRLNHQFGYYKRRSSLDFCTGIFCFLGLYWERCHWQMRQQWDNGRPSLILQKENLLKVWEILKGEVKATRRQLLLSSQASDLPEKEACWWTAGFIIMPNLPVIIQTHILKYIIHLFVAEIIIPTRKMSLCAITFFIKPALST